MNKQLRALLALVGAALLTLGVLVMPSGSASATEGTKPISAKALTDHECDSSESHFVITQVEPESNAPASITVNWDNGATEVVPLDKYTGKTAHYTTTSNLDSMVTSATADIYQGWMGEFNYSHGPCGAPQPDDKVTYTEWKDGDKSCESKTVTQTRSKTVTPYKWDGSKWVLDTDNAVTTTETQTRQMTEEELKECEGTPPPDSCPPLTGSIKTTTADGTVVNGNTKYESKEDVYVYGDQLPEDIDTLYVRVTDPSGSVVLSETKQVAVSGGSFGPFQLVPYSDTPNQGGEYKVAVSSTPDFEPECTKYDNFKVKDKEEPPAEPEGKSDYTLKCELIVINVPTGVTPEGADYQYYLDGEEVTVGEHALTPGSHTLVLEVDGEPVDSDTFEVEECEEEPTPVSPPEPMPLDKCEPATGPTDDRINGLSDVNFTFLVDDVEAKSSSFVAVGTSHTVKAVAKEGVVVKEGAKTEWTFTFTKVACVTTTEPPTPTETPTTPTETPTTPTENPTPTTPTETPTPEIGTPTSTSVPTTNPNPTSTPSVIPPHTGASDGWTGGMSATGGDSSLTGLMSRIAIIGGLFLLGLAVLGAWPRRRKVTA